jgi:hypothetical protein
MSYDLHLLRQDVAAADPTAAYEALEEQEEREPSPMVEEELRRLVADLQAASPGLDLAEQGRGFSLQLGYESERPVVIDITAGEITMSWSYGAEDASPALAEVRTYLPVFERHGYVAYDPQLERIFDPDRDAAVAEETHRYVRERAFGEGDRSWWHRLLGRR